MNPALAGAQSTGLLSMLHPLRELCAGSVISRKAQFLKGVSAGDSVGQDGYLNESGGWWDPEKGWEQFLRQNKQI